MASYIGVRCPVCNKKFTEADDIVVCPVCGAPHHRSCYAGQGNCVFAEDHLSGKEWSDPAGRVTDNGESSGERICARCGGKNAPDAIFCDTCGYPMALPDGREIGAEPPDETPFQWGIPGGLGMRVDAISMVYGGLSPDEEIEGESVKELARYVGGGSAYYLPRFRVMSEYGRSLMPNFFAFIFGFFYFFYRKMYAIGALLLVITAVSLIPQYLYYTNVVLPSLLEQIEAANPGVLQQLGVAAAEASPAVAEHYWRFASVAQTVRLVIVLFFSLFANRLYYNKAIAAVHTIRGQRPEADTEDRYYGALSRAGGTSKATVSVLAAVCVLACFVVSYLLLYGG